MELEEKSSATIQSEKYDLMKEMGANELYIEATKKHLRYLERINEKLQDEIHERQHILDMRAEAGKLNRAA